MNMNEWKSSNVKMKIGMKMLDDDGDDVECLYEKMMTTMKSFTNISRRNKTKELCDMGPF